jgi:hypothetical protein
MAIEYNPSNYPIRTKKSKKGFGDGQIEDYIGNFETLGCLVRAKIVNPNMVYDELSYDIEKAWCNHDVRGVINDARKADGINSGPAVFYSAFEKLAKFSLNKDKKTCSDIDKE